MATNVGPTITDWMMVGITVVYVVATIFICVANWKSANASKKQLAEMQEQYEADNRAYIEVELIYEKRSFFGLRFVNHGKKTAQHVEIQIDPAFIDSLHERNFAELLRQQTGKECIIGVGQHYDLFFGTSKYRDLPDKVAATGQVHYQSNGKEFSCDFHVDLDNYAAFFSVTSEQEDMLNRIEKHTQELAQIKKAILSLQSVIEKDNSSAQQ